MNPWPPKWLISLIFLPEMELGCNLKYIWITLGVNSSRVPKFKNHKATKILLLATCIFSAGYSAKFPLCVGLFPDSNIFCLITFDWFPFINSLSLIDLILHPLTLRQGSCLQLWKLPLLSVNLQRAHFSLEFSLVRLLCIYCSLIVL